MCTGAQVQLGVIEHGVDERLGQLGELLVPRAHRGLCRAQTSGSSKASSSRANGW